MTSILVVEDEHVLGRTISEALCEDGFRANWVPSAEDAIDSLHDRTVDLALLDLRLPGMSGMELLRLLSEQHPDTVCIMMTAKGDVEVAVEAMKLGAADFLVKPLDLDALAAIARRQSNQRRMVQNWKYVQKDHASRFGLHQFLGNCPEIERAKGLVRKLSRISPAANTAPPSVLVSGPTGTGKDLIARAIHYEGPRRDGPFVQVNCAAIPESLLESELFGHAKGAFTSAQSAKRGLFEVADGGTIFMDELGTLDLALQSKLLVAIETCTVRPVGSLHEVAVDVQIVAAMNQEPNEWLRQGKLRDDLYHRLRVIHVELPPLSARGGDLDLLATHFIKSHCRKFGLDTKKLSEKARARLRSYHWPGNVRELANQLESAVLLSTGELIEEDYLPDVRRNQSISHVGFSGGELQVDFSKGPISLEAVECTLIRRALDATNQNVTKAASLLGLSRDTLRYRVEKHGFGERRNGTRT